MSGLHLRQAAPPLQPRRGTSNVRCSKANKPGPVDNFWHLFVLSNTTIACFLLLFLCRASHRARGADNDDLQIPSAALPLETALSAYSICSSLPLGENVVRLKSKLMLGARGWGLLFTIFFEFSRHNTGCQVRISQCAYILILLEGE